MPVSRRQLDELWVQGAQIDVSPEGDGSLMVFARKMGPRDHQTAVRRANAERIRVKELLSKKETDEQLSVITYEVANMDLDTMINFLVELEIAPEREKVEQELSEDDEWAKDGRLQSIVDSWEQDGLMEEWIKGEGKRSEESENAFNEMKKFADAVDEAVSEKKEGLKAQMAALSEDEVRDKVIGHFLDREAGVAWLKTFNEYQILFGIEDIETGERIYEDIAEVQNLPIDLWSRFMDGFDKIKIPPKEVKS